MADEAVSMEAGLITLMKEELACEQAREREREESSSPLDFPYHPSVPFFILEGNKTRVVRGRMINIQPTVCEAGSQ